jgi:hypothetical protein
LDVELRTAHDSYSVFTEDPGKGGQVVVPGATGWLGSGVQTTVNISGNNAKAYLDTDNNNGADSGGTSVTDGNFLTAVDLGAAPSTVGNKAVSVQNLFYLNNVVHDILYGHGFDEAAGNFQANNFGNGGAGNDPVNAEAQDGGGTDNANFTTPGDGSSPRMQMYLWHGTGPTHEVQVDVSNYGAFGAEFGAALNTSGINGTLAIASPVDGCTAISKASVQGKIAIIDRGACNFTVKVAYAQSAGALGVIVANNDGGLAFTMGGVNRKIKIPSVPTKTLPERKFTTTARFSPPSCGG